MPAGLQVFSQAGNKIFDSEWGHARILGRFKTSTITGSMAVTSSDGSPVNNLFAFAVPFTEMSGVASGVSNALWCEGSTIYWENFYSNADIVYGDGYA